MRPDVKPPNFRSRIQGSRASLSPIAIFLSPSSNTSQVQRSLFRADSPFYTISRAGETLIMSLGSYSFSRNTLSLILVLATTLQFSYAASPLNFPTPYVGLMDGISSYADAECRTNLVVCNTTTLAWTGGTGQSSSQMPGPRN